MFRTVIRVGVFLLMCGAVIIGAEAFAQNEPYITHETRPIIMEGPYLVAPSGDGITVVWMTDTDCHSRVDYGETPALGQVAEDDSRGLLPVGTTHAIRLSGLVAGQTYHYKAVSTRVVKLKAYWPEKGLSAESAVYRFTVPNPRSETAAFAFLADTQHENVRRFNSNLDVVDWDSIEFLVHGGDAFDSIENKEQLFAKFLGPISRRLKQSKPLVFVRGNHDMRGKYARQLYQYVPTHSGEYYYSFDAGPAHFLVLDSGEDKDDDTNVYAGLNRTESYREREFKWLQNHIQSEPRVSEAAFRIALIHAPNWGWVDGQRDKWTTLSNRAGIDLMIAGHRHRYSWTPAGSDGRDYPVLVVGQDQVAHVEVSSAQIEVVVTDTESQVVGENTVTRRTQSEDSFQAERPYVQDFSDIQLGSWVYDEKVTSVRESKQFPGSKELLQTRVRGTVAYPKDLQFEDGVIECDMAGGAYLGISFRIQEIEGKRLSEDIYFRIDGNERSKTVQYYPHGQLEQQELHRPPYEEAIRLIKQNEWFHVRIEVQDRQARVFLDDNDEPVQIVEDLMHDHTVGSVGVRSWGGRFANLKVTPWRTPTR